MEVVAMSKKEYFGIYQGVVTNINDPEKRARIKVICPDVLGADVESAWCDPVVTVAYDNGGDLCVPAKDETVWIQFIAGDVNRPVYLGGWWQKSMTPLGSNYSNVDKLRIIKYADCTITMQSGKIDINIASGDFDLRIEDGLLTINGDVIVNGNIKVDSIYGNNRGSGEMVVDAIRSKTIVNGSSISTATLKANSIDTGTLDASADATASGVSLKSHTHTGVHGKTSSPN